MHLSFWVTLLITFQSTDNIHFAKFKSIDLSSDYPISVIEQVDVDKSGNILITDSTTGSVYLYTMSEESFKKLDSRECHPGFNHQPIRTVFTGSEIWMMHAHSQVFRFSVQGECIGAIDSFFSVPHLFGGSIETSLAGFSPYNFNLNKPVINLYSEEAETIKQIDLNSQIIAPNMSFRFLGGGIIARDSTIYLATSSSPAIYEIKDVAVTKHLPEISGVTYNVNDDLNPGNRTLIAEIDRYRNTYTTVRNFFSLNDEYLALSIVSTVDSNEGLLLFNLNNKSFPYPIHEFTKSQYIDYVYNNKAYIFMEDTTRENIDWVINVYNIDFTLSD